MIEARSAGFNAADGSAEDEAIAELWRAVDKGMLEVTVHGPGDRWLKMSAEETKRVPLLRATRGGDFTFLRPGNPFHEVVVSQFGSRLGLVSLIFPRRQVEALALLVRRRRRSTARGGGRPSRHELLRPVIRGLVEEGRWDPTTALKALTRLVERAQKWPKVPSEDTVTRVAPSKARRTGENIAYGYDSFSKTLDQWINSSGHRQNLLMHGATKVGVASAKSATSGRTYWAMVIAGDYERPRSASAKTTKPRRDAGTCRLALADLCLSDDFSK
jgi:hypothetical protein